MRNDCSARAASTARTREPRRWIGFLLALACLAGVAPAARAAVNVPEGSAIVITLDQSVSSKDARTGQKLDGTVAEDVLVNGKIAVPKGSRALLSVADVQESGRLSTPAKLWLKIDSIEVKGRTYHTSTRWSGQTGSDHNKRNVVAIGGGTGAGALIGGLAGGGKGALIGAAVGAGAGTAGAAATGKKDIAFPAETKLRFVTTKAVAVN
jgi:hypothetical protein